ncbi:MAG: hypothetical protein RLZZ519_2328 [Bacteroidota bacterium]|jgi:hypothetical protein
MTMKLKLLLILVMLGFGLSVSAQNGNCPEIVVNIKKGTINKLKPTTTMDKIEAALPCFTGVTQESEGYNCGGGVFFINHDFYAYTGRDYWEIRKEFKGSWDTRLLNLKPADLEFRYGEPVREEKIPGFKVQFFAQKYGCLRVQFSVESGRSEEIGIHYLPAEKVELCY